MTTTPLQAQERYWNGLAAEQIRREQLVKAERLNGRLAMLGIVALIATEDLLHQGLLQSLGF
jgi:hypothetical protein